MRDKVFNITNNPKYDGCQRGLASIVYKCFHKKTSASGIKNEKISNNELAKKRLDKPAIRKLRKEKSKHLIWQYLGSWSCWYTINK